jgi:hypothetical protein
MQTEPHGSPAPLGYFQAPAGSILLWLLLSSFSLGGLSGHSAIGAHLKVQVILSSNGLCGHPSSTTQQREVGPVWGLAELLN